LRYNPPAFIAIPAVGWMNLRLLNPEIYDIDDDPSEGYDVSDEHPDVVAKILQQVRQQMLTMPWAVLRAWDDTQRRPVQPNGSGEWPGEWPVPAI